MYEDAFRRRGHRVLFFRYAPPMPERQVLEDVSSAKQPNPPYPGAPGWTRSVYYYWWRFLRINPEFKARISSGRSLEPGTVAYDFRHVFDMNFRDWWAEQGRFLFCEPEQESIRVEVPPVSEDDIGNRLLVSIPAHANLEQALADMRSLLQPVLASNKAAVGGSRARYPVWSKPVLTSLEQHFRIWRKHQETPDATFIELADELGIIGGASDELEARNMKSAIVSRAVNQASFMIEQVAQGRFPVMTQKQLDKGLSKFPNIPPSGLAVPPIDEASAYLIAGSAYEGKYAP
jgi:hypothetical protein